MVTAVAYRDGNGQIYVDGVPDRLLTSISHRSGSMDNGYDLLIGQTIASFGAPGNFLGDMDEVRIYSRALSSTEISQLAVVPIPSAFLLGMIGLSIAGVKLHERV